MLEELEETLIAADLGAAAAGAFVKRVRDEIKRGRVVTSPGRAASLHRFLEESLAGASAPLILDAHPTVILMLGVNGAGKTTSTAKLAASLKADGKSVLMAAADTFRAAAIEQLRSGGDASRSDVIHQAPGADPAAVVFDAVKAAHSRDVGRAAGGHRRAAAHQDQPDGRAHQAQARRRRARCPAPARVADGAGGARPARTGSQQARMFHEAVGLTGLVLTKLDGTAKGGIAVRIHQELGVPIKLVGVGEQIEDLQPFDPETFVDALVGSGAVSAG